MFIDGLLLIKEDIKLGAVFGLLNTLPNDGEVDKEKFLTTLRALYLDYHSSLAWALVSPDDLIKHLRQRTSDSSVLSGRELEIVRIEAINQVRHGNLYTLRGIGFFIGPILVILATVKLFLALVL
jgi:hypothetical protein